MKLYLVYADVFTSGYGTCVQLVGIYDTRQEADKAIVNAKNENPAYKLYGRTVELNKRYPLFCRYLTDEEIERYEETYQQIIELAWYMG